MEGSPKIWPGLAQVAADINNRAGVKNRAGLDVLDAITIGDLTCCLAGIEDLEEPR